MAFTDFFAAGCSRVIVAADSPVILSIVFAVSSLSFLTLSSLEQIWHVMLYKSQ